MGNSKREVKQMKRCRIAHPETSPPEVPQPETIPLHPGSERPEINPPESPPEDEPVIIG